MGWTQFVLEHRAEILALTLEHIWLAGVSVAIAAAIGFPAGLVAFRRPAWGRLIVAAANVIQTVPSLALFGLLLPVPWFGASAGRLAITVLMLYSLLPIVRNTFAGLASVDASLIEAGQGMGMTGSQILWQLQLPLAMPVILAGLRVAVVLSIGIATIAAAVGAGGLGELIFRGVSMVDNRLILAGAVPAALLALLADLALNLVERAIRVPMGQSLANVPALGEQRPA